MDIEERQQLIEGILTQIRGINEEITKLSTLRMRLGSCVIAIDRNQQRWNQEYHVYQNMELAPEVRIMDKFEGLAATGLAADVPPTVSSITEVAGRMSYVKGGIADQNTRLEERITRLRNEINTLQASLSSI